MTFLLSLGSFLVAFSPSLSLLFTVVFPKPQLVILSITAAFFYLLSAFFSSLFWLPVPDGSAAKEGGIATLLALTIPSVIFQMAGRCSFVKLYFRVEGVIRRSVKRHEEETIAATHARNNDNRSHRSSNRNNDSTNNYDDDDDDEGSNDGDPHAETNALQLQLNDLSCSLSSGCGYALLHSLFLYGTLLASESGESSTSTGGTLYQPSCSDVPSLIHGAVIACLFSILDVMWMMLTFFGMRRRALYGGHGNDNNNNNSSNINNNMHNPYNGRATSSNTTTWKLSQWKRTVLESLTFLSPKGLSDSFSGGNAALGLVFYSHLLASLVLAPNGLMERDGCLISLPCLAGVVILVGVLFKTGVKGHFLPEDQRRRILGLRMEDVAASGAVVGSNGVIGNDNAGIM
eukprot:CAMPEP_0171337726 /NCGR_PEP_ID=MMETSP0878-20121228/6865_1 /TAXON_ID=67004 /ORGANISM="Thalassiosira weissflogii, Strain CCMP1336" /LENGTH=401 /DNA_ID=CAMNT_0011839385 /DNA_START=25 /DNA_END=1230 /DNA_ORIENTATION=-